MNKWKEQGHFYMGNCMGNQIHQLFFLQFQPSSYRDLGFKIPKTRGDPKKNCHKIWIYCIQNYRTEHTKWTKKTAAFKVVIRPRNLRKTVNISWFGLVGVILECFSQISLADCNFEGCSSFCSVRVFCAVILNTIRADWGAAISILVDWREI